MAKPPKPKKSNPADKKAGGGKIKSARVTLAIAAVLSILSLGGGLYFARYAFQKDAETFELETVPEDETEVTESEESEAKADKKKTEYKGDGKDGEAQTEEEEEGSNAGLLEFADITTNMNGFDLNGRPVRSFLKLSIVMVYTPSPEAKSLMKERQPFMRDLFNTYIRSLTEADVRGSIGILTIKSELLKRARAAVGNELPQEILIQDLIVN
jgi:flagellar protein FliL